MTTRVKVTSFSTRPYTPDELSSMESNELEKVRGLSLDKVIDEVTLEELLVADLQDLRQNILRIVEANAPRPIVVTNLDNDNDDPAFKHAFLIERGYRAIDKDPIMEIIIFRPKDVKSYQEKMEREMKQWKSKQATEAEQAEFMKKAIPEVIEQSVRVISEQHENWLKELGFADNEEYIRYSLDLLAKRNDFENEEQYMDFYRAEWDKRIEEARERKRQKEFLMVPKPEMGDQLPTILNDEMRVLCRIIGKGGSIVSMHQQYYFKWHGIIESVMAVGNHAADNLSVKFVYPAKESTSDK